MEKGKSLEIDKLSIELQERALAHLEQPDNIYTCMGYKFNLPSDYSVVIDDRTETNNDNPSESEHVTSAFMHYSVPVEDETVCGHRLALSTIFNHTERRLSGVQLVSTSNLPSFRVTNQQEQAVAEGLVRLAEHTYDFRNNDEDRPYLHVHYSVEEDQLSGDLEVSLYTLISGINNALAGGTYHVRKRSVVTGETGRAWIEANEVTGPEKHLRAPSDLTSKLLVKASDDGFEHSFIVLDDGGFELRTVISEFGERYRGYRTFKPDSYDKDGRVCGFSINYSEILEKEAEDRAYGLFVPTVEKLNLILDRVMSAS